MRSFSSKTRMRNADGSMAVQGKVAAVNGADPPSCSAPQALQPSDSGIPLPASSRAAGLCALLAAAAAAARDAWRPDPAPLPPLLPPADARRPLPLRAAEPSPPAARLPPLQLPAAAAAAAAAARSPLPPMRMPDAWGRPP